MPVSTKEYLSAADQLLGSLGRDALLSEKEVEPIRRGIVAGAKKDGEQAIKGMKTARVGRARILVPTSENFRKANIASVRTRERFSKFKVEWLNKENLKKNISEGWSKADRREFHRHSNRLARNAREFLARIKELEPSLDEEVEATIQQIDDASNDLLKLEVRSFTRLNENLRRSIGGRSTRESAGATIETFDLDRNLWNQSLLEHPKATVRQLLDNANSKMAARRKVEVSEIPKRAFVFVGSPPDAVAKMAKGSRTAQVLWRVFSIDEVSKRFAALNTTRQAASSYRGLGLGHGTNDWYVPIPPENLDEVREEMKKRRSEFQASLQER